MSYIADTDIANYLNLTLQPDGQAVVDSIIAGIEPLVDNYCNRTWTTANNTTQITENFDGGTKRFYIATPPINSIVSVSIDGNPQDSNFYFNYGSYVELFDEADKGNLNVQIVYTTNATQIPADLKQALIQWVAQLFRESQDAGKQTVRVQEGPVQTYFKQEGDIPDFVLRVLDLYRLPPAF